MSCAVEMVKPPNFSTISERFRLMLGLVMVFAGLYFGLFSVGIGEGLGILSVMASPFVIVADK